MRNGEWGMRDSGMRNAEMRNAEMEYPGENSFVLHSPFPIPHSPFRIPHSCPTARTATSAWAAPCCLRWNPPSGLVGSPADRPQPGAGAPGKNGAGCDRSDSAISIDWPGESGPSTFQTNLPPEAAVRTFQPSRKVHQRPPHRKTNARLCWLGREIWLWHTNCCHFLAILGQSSEARLPAKGELLVAIFNRATSSPAQTALIYITVGTLALVWTGVWYFYLLNHTPDHPTVYYWVGGTALTGLTLVIIGLAVGQIGRAARHAEAGPPVVAAPANSPAVVPTAQIVPANVAPAAAAAAVQPAVANYVPVERAQGAR